MTIVEPFFAISFRGFKIIFPHSPPEATDKFVFMEVAQCNQASQRFCALKRALLERFGSTL